jgi:hypothetical protein
MTELKPLESATESGERLRDMKEIFNEAVERFKNRSPEEWLKKESQKPVKDCPFCGGKGHLINMYVQNNTVFRYGFVKCLDKNCGMNTVAIKYEKWNRRPE